MPPQLHPELIDVIIDHLHHDKHALAQCSRVCRRWRFTSQLHLFYVIILRGDNHFQDFLSNFVLDTNILPTTAIRLRSYIHVLELRPLLEQEDRNHYDISIWYSELSRVFASLPALHTLVLEQVSLNLRDFYENSYLWFAPRKMRALVLVHLKGKGLRRTYNCVEAFSASEWALFFCLFSAVGELCIQSCGLGTEVAGGGFDSWLQAKGLVHPRHHLEIAKLTIGSVGASPFYILRHLCLCRTGETLRYLHVDAMDCDTWTCLGELFSVPELPLEELFLCMYPTTKSYVPGVRALNKAFSFSQCTKLSSLTLSIALELCSDNQSNISQWRFVLGVLAVVPTTSLKEFELWVNFVEERDLEVLMRLVKTLDWARFEQNLVTINVLERVCVRYRPLDTSMEQHTDRLWDYTKQRLSLLNQQGILEKPTPLRARAV